MQRQLECPICHKTVSYYSFEAFDNDWDNWQQLVYDHFQNHEKKELSLILTEKYIYK